MHKDSLKLDKKSFSIISLKENENNSDVKFWLSKTPQERIQAVEYLRQLMYGYDPATERLQRFFETAEFKTN